MNAELNKTVREALEEQRERLTHRARRTNDEVRYFERSLREAQDRQLDLGARLAALDEALQ